MSKIKLLSKPFQNAIRETSSNLSQIQDSLDMIKDVVSPITSEIETPFNATDIEPFSNESRFVRTVDPNGQQIAAKSIQNSYVSKIHDRCKLQMESAGVYAFRVCDSSSLTN